MKSKQSFLSDIVKTWKVNMEPEFRGFRCGVCQQSLEKAYHYTLDSKEYLVSVHLCEKCQKDINIEADLFVLPTAQAGDEEGGFKAFQCDTCDTELTESYHVWNKEGSKLIETHLCKSCGNEIYD
jgi:RNase P subunit RPR2